MQFMHTLTYKEDDLHRLLMSLEKETSAKMISRTWILFVGHVPARFICWLSPFLMPDVGPIVCRCKLECHRLLSSFTMLPMSNLAHGKQGFWVPSIWSKELDKTGSITVVGSIGFAPEFPVNSMCSSSVLLGILKSRLLIQPHMATGQSLFSFSHSGMLTRYQL